MKSKSLKKPIIILAITVFAILFITIKSNAASLSISTSKSTVAPGESYTVTVTLSNGAGYISSGGRTEWLDNSSFSYTKTAGSSGSETITASGVVADYATEDDESVSQSKVVTISAPSSGGNTSSGNSGGGRNTSSGSTSQRTKTQEEETPKSSDSSLKDLTIEQGAISPEFSTDVKEYSLIIPYETTEVKVSANANDSKAKVEITGDKELQEGENIVTITVTAEDGSKTEYTVKVIRKRVPLALASLVIKYQNQEGEIIEIPLNPLFAFDKLEYSLEDLEYWVEKLIIEATPNIEGAEVKIEGADNLQTGENTITITVKIAEEQFGEVNVDEETGEEIPNEPKEETITYTIKVNKNEKPGFFTRVSNWFKGLMGTIDNWFNGNKEKVVLGSLIACIVALFGLSIYIIIDYKKYRDLLIKLEKLQEMNNTNAVTENDSISSIGYSESSNNIENNNNDDRPKGGKRFRK